MGQKVNPHGLRVGVIKDWSSRWYADKKDFAKFLEEDFKIRRTLKKKYYSAGISKIEIERSAKKIKLSIYTAKPGVIIGKGGAGIEVVKSEVQKIDSTCSVIVINIVEVKAIDMDAQLVAENIALQLERRVSFRRAMKQAIGRTMKATLRADIDYGFAEANTTYGKLGVKVWIYKGEVLSKKRVVAKEEKM